MAGLIDALQGVTLGLGLLLGSIAVLAATSRWISRQRGR
jgi:hypothetical protein